MKITAACKFWVGYLGAIILIMVYGCNGCFLTTKTTELSTDLNGGTVTNIVTVADTNAVNAIVLGVRTGTAFAPPPYNAVPWDKLTELGLTLATGLLVGHANGKRVQKKEKPHSPS